MMLRFNKARLSKKARFLLIPSGFVVIELSSNKRLWVTGNTGKNGGAEGILWPHSQRHQLVHQDFLWCWKWTVLPNAGSSGLWKVHLRSVLYAATGEDTLGSEKVLFFFFFYGQDQRVYGEPWGDLSWSSASDDPALSSPEGGDKELLSAGKQPWPGRKDVHEWPLYPKFSWPIWRLHSKGSDEADVGPGKGSDRQGPGTEHEQGT